MDNAILSILKKVSLMQMTYEIIFMSCFNNTHLNLILIYYVLHKNPLPNFKSYWLFCSEDVSPTSAFWAWAFVLSKVLELGEIFQVQ